MYDVEKQHKKGKLHAIERIEQLLDPGSFVEMDHEVSNIENNFGLAADSLPYDGVITGYGTIHNQLVYLYSQDFTVMGGTLGKNHGFKIAKAIQEAIKHHCPIIGINDSGGARIQEGVDALAGYGEIFYYNTLASGEIPQIAIIAGPCAGGAVYSPGIMDFIFVIDDISTMFVTGPKVIKSVTNETISAEDLGGAKVHSGRSGVAHFRCDSEKDCYESVRNLLNVIPHSCNFGKSHRKKYQYIEKSQDGIGAIIPDSPNKPYDMNNIIHQLFDADSFIEVSKDFAKNVVVGFAKLSGITVGIVANQSKCMAGVLDVDSSDKAARFIRYCDCYDVPIITLTDVPGFLPGSDQEFKGIIRHGAKLLYAYSEATTTKLNVILRKSYGGAYIAMSSRHLRADEVYVWSNAEIAVMGAEAACQIIYAKELKKLEGDSKKEFLEEKVKDYENKAMNATNAIKEKYVNPVISPEETRRILFDDLVRLNKKKKKRCKQYKKHGNIPL